ncbi:MAG: HAD-IA family hydrolase [Clostridia bacterium]|nr:HAD-IA family hydrolase [Clostridia bacterium]
MIRFLFIDMGGTLADETLSWQARFRVQAQMEEAKAKGVTEEDLKRAVERASREYRRIYRGALDELGIREMAPYDPALERLYPQAKETLRGLRARYPLGLIANQGPGLKDRLAAFGIRDFFQVVVSSFDVGLKKPDPAIFYLALDRANVRPGEAVMIGDRLDNDVFPAKALGMKTVWVRQGFGALQTPRSPAATPDWSVSSLSELLSIDFQ